MTNRRSHLTLVGVLLAALAGVAALGIPGSPVHKKVNLGLDLQGGLEVVYKAHPPKDEKVTSQGMDLSVNRMRDRVDKLGVSEPEIRKQGADQIVIELPGVHDPARAAQIIGTTAQLELYDLETSLVSPYSVSVTGAPLQTSDLYALLKRVQPLAKKGEPSAFYVFGKAKSKPFGPAETRQEALKLAKDSGLKKPITVLSVPEKMIVITCGSKEAVCPGNGGQGGGNTIAPPPQGTTYYYLFTHDKTAEGIPGLKGIPQMTGSDLKLSGTRQDFDPTTNEPVVLMQFTGSGSDKFRKVTSEEYNRGRNRNVAQHFAIVLDREIRSFPQIDYTKSYLAGGISGNAEISGIG
jgi:protein-export membrane protein SecD